MQKKALPQITASPMSVSQSERFMTLRIIACVCGPAGAAASRSLLSKHSWLSFVIPGF